MQLIVPMAGLGQRFAEAGYALPKPLIPVSGLPMIVRAVGDLPPAERTVFIVHPQHVAQYEIDSVLREHFPGAQVVVTPGLTAGQACTVRLAAEHIDPQDDVMVAACDATHVYDAEKLRAAMNTPGVESLIWTYRGDARVLRSPTSYGWVRTRGETSDVVEVSCKRPISETPLADHVVSGFFWFRTASRMLSAIDALVASNRRVNNEFYLDVVPNVLLEAGERVLAFEAEKYIGWGTPQELRDYECWERYFTSAARNSLV